MEVVEEVTAVPPPPPPPTNKDLSSPIAIKGKRTKRLRPHSPISFTITTPLIDDNSNNSNNIIINNSNNDNNLHLSHSFSPASSEESTTTAEVDTARCLILLSRGHFPNYPPNDHQYNSKLQNTKNRYTNNNNNKTCGYTCKTCNRVFPSFQALGGHRASHKKPKNEKKMAILSDEDDFPSPSMSSSKKRFLSNSLSLQLSNISSATFSATPKSSPSPRIHECSYCGAEFTSGQALGGHMRKHRGGPANRTASFPIELEIEESKIQPRNLGLSLDLNLPAPEEKNEGGATTGHVLSTTPPPLVDCRY